MFIKAFLILFIALFSLPSLSDSSLPKNYRKCGTYSKINFVNPSDKCAVGSVVLVVKSSVVEYCDYRYAIVPAGNEKRPLFSCVLAYPPIR